MHLLNAGLSPTKQKQNERENHTNEAVIGELMQFMDNKCAEVSEYQHESQDGYKRVLMKCGLTEDQARIAIGNLK